MAAGCPLRDGPAMRSCGCEPRRAVTITLGRKEIARRGSLPSLLRRLWRALLATGRRGSVHSQAGSETVGRRAADAVADPAVLAPGLLGRPGWRAALTVLGRDLSQLSRGLVTRARGSRGWLPGLPGYADRAQMHRDGRTAGCHRRAGPAASGLPAKVVADPPPGQDGSDALEDLGCLWVGAAVLGSEVCCGCVMSVRLDLYAVRPGAA